MPPLIKPQHPPSTTRADSHERPSDLSSPRSLSVPSPRGLALPPLPMKGEIWLAGLGQREGSPLQVLVVSCDAMKLAPRRTVLPLQPCEPSFEGTLTRFAVAATPETGLQQMVAVDAEMSRAMAVQYLTRCVGRVPAELMLDITDGLSLVLGCV